MIKIIINLFFLYIISSCTSYSVYYDELSDHSKHFQDKKNTFELNKLAEHSSALAILISKFSANHTMFISNDREVVHSGPIICNEKYAPYCNVFYVFNNDRGEIKIKINNKEFRLPDFTVNSYEFLIIQYDFKNRNRYDIELRNFYDGKSITKRIELGNNAKKYLLPKSKQSKSTILLNSQEQSKKRN